MIYISELQITIDVFLVSIFLLSIAVEAATEILTSSELTNPLRKKWKKWTYPLDAPPEDTYIQHFKVWFDKLISCGYCTSVWVAGFFGIFTPKLDLGHWIINWLIITFVLHRLATWIHVIYELVKKGRVKTYDFEVQLKIQDPEKNDGSIRESPLEESAEVESFDDEVG